MRLTAAAHKSVTDLTRRRARAVFTVMTLAIAVASVGIFGVTALMQQAMDREIAATRLADLTVTTKPLVMTDAQLRAVERLPNVAAVQPKSIISTRVYVGARRQKALVIGVPDFARQQADVISVESGAAPAGGTLLADNQNAAKDKFAGGAGTPVRVVAADGRERPLRVSGVGRYLGGGQLVANEGFAVFYATPQTVASLSGAAGYTMLAMRLEDASRAAAERTAAAVRAELRSVKGFSGFADYPEIRKPGDYPGKELFEQIATIMTAITFLALLSAFVLLSNTMSTLIGEQTREIAAMKAIGATRRQIARIYRRTALLLGVLGAGLGVVLGVVLANAVTAYFGSAFYGIHAGFRVDPAIVGASLLVGLVGPPLAAIPAIRRASRLPVREALDATGSSVGGEGRLDALLRRVTVLPRPAQIGLRGAARRRRRAAATAAQVALAVATVLALLALGTSVGNMTRAFFDDARWDVWASTYASKPFRPGGERLVKAIPGVREAQPMLSNTTRIAGRSVFTFGLAQRPMYAPTLSAGRWYTAAQERACGRGGLGGGARRPHGGGGIGGTVPSRPTAGPARVRVVGLTTNEDYQGAVAYMPLGALQSILRTPGEVNNYLVHTASQDHAAIDRITTRLEDTLGANGNQLTTLVKYVSRRDAVAANSGITTTITVLGLLIVAISMVGLVNAITMGVIERTREIGTLRCVGARARDVRRIFMTEGLIVAGLGWLVGVPLGWALAHGLISLTQSTADTDLAFVFPAWHVAVTLVLTVLLAMLVLIAPLRRAVRLKPGDALRYA